MMVKRGLTGPTFLENRYESKFGNNLEPKAGGPYYLPRFAVERTFSYNIMASGGNVGLLNLGEV